MRTSPNSVQSVIDRAWAPSTIRRYSASVRKFWKWCHDSGVPACARLPASEDLLCAYAMTFVGRMAASSINARMNAIRAWHIRMGHPYLAGIRLVYLMRGADSYRPDDSIRSPRLPLTTEMISYLQQRLDFSSSRDVCVFACLTLTFWGQLRSGELFPKVCYPDDSQVIPRWYDFGLPNNDGSRTLFLPSTKTKQKVGDTVIIAKQQPEFDPITAIHAHSIKSKPAPHHFIASFIDDHGRRVGMTLELLLNIINPIFTAGGFYPISGHCPRIGGTTELLISGVPPEVVKMTGRWASDSFYKYWRSLEVIAPRYLENCTVRYNMVPTPAVPASSSSNFRFASSF